VNAWEHDSKSVTAPSDACASTRHAPLLVLYDLPAVTYTLSSFAQRQTNVQLVTIYVKP